jgi:hypothetical protein
VITEATSIKSSLEYLLKLIVALNLLINALSKTLNKFVVAIMGILLLRLSKPFSTAEVALPISLKSLAFILSIAIASISSNKIIALSGCFRLLISSNKLAIFLAVCPSLLSITVSKSTANNSLSSILAICFAVSVFPVPGAPSNKNLLIPAL